MVQGPGSSGNRHESGLVRLAAYRKRVSAPQGGLQPVELATAGQRTGFGSEQSWLVPTALIQIIDIVPGGIRREFTPTVASSFVSQDAEVRSSKESGNGIARRPQALGDRG